MEATFPCRSKQIDTLRNLFGAPDKLLPECIYVYGCQSTGKTSIVAGILDELRRKHAIINLVECYTSKLLFEGLLNKLTGHRIDPTKGASYAKCDSLMEFLEQIKKYSLKESLDGAFIVLDKAERLRNMEWNLLPGFMRLRELSDLNVCVVLISELIFERFYACTEIIEPIKIYFPQYNKDQLQEILSKDFEHSKNLVENHYNKPLEFDLTFFQKYLNVFLSVFYRACRDLRELRHMSRINFIKYCSPIAEGVCTPDDQIALWRHISPILKSSLDVLYLRITPTEGLEHLETSDNEAHSLELPFYAKHLLVAAYLASYNSPKDDKRLFMKHHGKKRKTMRDVKAKSKVDVELNTQLGPKAFTLDRLLAIFYSILDDKVGFNNNLLVQVSSLVELQLLTSVTSDAFSLDGQKYKCNVNFDYVQTVAKMVSFNIRKYLADFCHIFVDVLLTSMRFNLLTLEFRKVSNSTDILQQRAFLLCDDEQLVLIMWPSVKRQKNGIKRLVIPASLHHRYQ